MSLRRLLEALALLVFLAASFTYGCSQDALPLPFKSRRLTVGEQSFDITETLLRAMGGREQFERSFHARSHFPEQAAKRALSDAELLWRQGSDAVTAAGGSDEMLSAWQGKFTRLWLGISAPGLA